MLNSRIPWPFHPIFALILTIGLACPLSAQDSPDRRGGSSLDLGVSGIGISFGNQPRWTGLRLNWQDQYLERIDGVNITLWKPGDHVDGSVNGLAFGLAPKAGDLRGFSLGVLGVLPERTSYGVTVGGLGIVSGGPTHGLSIAGLGLVTDGGSIGVNLAGLGIVSEGTVAGVNLGGLGIISDGTLAGVNAAGLGIVSEGTVSGVNLAGLGIVAAGAISGINLAGLGIVSERGIHGVNASLLGMVTERGLSGITLTGLGAVAEHDVTGVTVAGLGVVSDRAIRGLAAALLKVDTRNLRGVTVAGWTRVRGSQQGLSIALFNQAEELHGVQLGLLNFAGNNHGLTRWLPLVNLHLH